MVSIGLAAIMFRKLTFKNENEANRGTMRGNTFYVAGLSGKGHICLLNAVSARRPRERSWDGKSASVSRGQEKTEERIW